MVVATVGKAGVAGHCATRNDSVKDGGRGYTGPAGLHDFTEIRQLVVQGAIDRYPVPGASG